MYIKISQRWAISSISKIYWAITSELLGNCPMAPPLATPLTLNKMQFDYNKFLDRRLDHLLIG